MPFDRFGESDQMGAPLASAPTSATWKHQRQIGWSQSIGGEWVRRRIAARRKHTRVSEWNLSLAVIEVKVWPPLKCRRFTGGISRGNHPGRIHCSFLVKIRLQQIFAGYPPPPVIVVRRMSRRLVSRKWFHLLRSGNIFDSRPACCCRAGAADTAIIAKRQ